MDFTTDDYRELQTKLIDAAQSMKRDGWWLNEEQQPGREGDHAISLNLGNGEKRCASSETAGQFLHRNHAAQKGRPSRLA